MNLNAVCQPDVVTRSSPFMPVPINIFWRYIPDNNIIYAPLAEKSFINVPRPRPDSTLSDYCEFYKTKFQPSFTIHILSSIMSTEPRKPQHPSVIWGRDCWIIQPHFCRCFALGGRLYWDHNYTILAAYEYGNIKTRSYIQQIGVVVVPTRHIFHRNIGKGVDRLRKGEITDEFEWWRDQDWDSQCWRGHQEGQLTFPHHNLPRLHGAESFPGFKDIYGTELEDITKSSWQLVRKG